MKDANWKEFPGTEVPISPLPQLDQDFEAATSGSETPPQVPITSPAFPDAAQSGMLESTPVPLPPPLSRRRFSASRIIVLVAIALAVIGASVGGLLLLTSYQAAQQQQANSTATAQVYARQTANANATGTAQAKATASSVAATATTIAANPNPYPPYKGTLAAKEPLDTSSAIFPNVSRCTFVNSAYQVSAGANYIAFCNSELPYRNIAVQVEMKILQGDAGGMLFRYDAVSDNFYYFSIFQNGSWAFGFYFGKTEQYTAVAVNTSPAIKTGPGQTNLVAFVANGETYSLYVNKARIYTLTIQQANNAFQEGKIALCAFSAGQPTDVAYKNFEMWTL